MRFWIIICLLLSFISLKSQTKRALITGIGNYPVESDWRPINGDNDVPLIYDVLIQKSFEPDNIIRLVNEKATKENILKKIDQLTQEARQNDIIYIHFSTHGQQVVDLDGDEEDGLDEAVIPFDARKSFVKGQYEGENHLLDDELNEILLALRNKIGETGTLLVVIDACHSGDATRGELNEDDEVIFRGTSEIFKAEKNIVYENANLKTIEWVVISATQPHQNNYEYKINGSYFGSLSYALKLALPEINNEADFTQLFKLIQMKRKEMDVARYPQRPMIEGNNIYQNQKVF